MSVDQNIFQMLNGLYRSLIESQVQNLMSELGLEQKFRLGQESEVGVKSRIECQDQVGSNFGLKVGCKVESRVESRVSIESYIGSWCRKSGLNSVSRSSFKSGQGLNVGIESQVRSRLLGQILGRVLDWVLDQESRQSLDSEVESRFFRVKCQDGTLDQSSKFFYMIIDREQCAKDINRH